MIGEPEVVGFVKDQVEKLMKEADLRHSRTNVRRQRVTTTPVNAEAEALPRLPSRQ